MKTHHIDVQIGLIGICDRIHDGDRMVCSSEFRSSEEELLEEVRGRVPIVEVLCVVEGDVERCVTGPLGAKYPNGRAVECQ